MKVVQINGGVFGSTGRIMFGIADVLEKNGNETLCFSPVTTTNRSKEPNHKYIKIGSFRSRQINVLLSRITGFEGCFAYFSTKRVLKKISEFKPDVIHLHTLHGGFINFSLLFKYIKKNKIKTIWTLHDCWSFTGHCPHFTVQKCDKWKSGCNNCPSYREYPESLFDNSKKMYRLKKKWFSNIPCCTLVTPSYWLEELVNQSFLSQYPVRVIHNGIDLSVFRPTPSDFRRRCGLENDKIILGVAFGWSYKKGLDVFVHLANELPKNYRVVLVGTDDTVDRKIPKSVISIHRIHNQKELAQIYSASDIFVNPTREETFGLVNIEALACGTPVVLFHTGGSVECIDESCGVSVNQNDIDLMCKQIEYICVNKCFITEDCVSKAQHFNDLDKFRDYYLLYKESFDE